MARFDAHASSYDDFGKTPLGQFVITVERRLLARLLHAHRGQHGVDVGCGIYRVPSTLWLPGDRGG